MLYSRVFKLIANNNNNKRRAGNTVGKNFAKSLNLSNKMDNLSTTLNKTLKTFINTKATNRKDRYRKVPEKSSGFGDFGMLSSLTNNPIGPAANNQENTAQAWGNNNRRGRNVGEGPTNYRDSRNRRKGAPVLDAEVAAFALAMSDPFSIKETSLPAMPLLSHQSCRNYSSGTFVCNGTGFGSVSVIPCYTVTNDLSDAVITSTAGSPNAFETAGAGTSASFAMNGPYNSGAYDLGANYGLQFRFVALGIRIRFQGTAVNAAGQCYTLELEPKSATRLNQIGGYTIPEIKANPNWKEYSVMNGGWHGVVRHILSRKDLDFQGINFTPQMPPASSTIFQYAELWSPISNQSSLDMTQNIGIAVQSSAAATFEWEVVTHYEVVGTNLPTRILSGNKELQVMNYNHKLRLIDTKDNDSPAHSIVGSPDVKIPVQALIRPESEKMPTPIIHSEGSTLGTVASILETGWEILGDFL
jgi:hypothetical protein